VATLPVQEQREIVARGEREILATAKAIRAKQCAKRRAEWDARTIRLANQTAPLPSDRRYPVILADPPWEFRVFNRNSGSDRCAEAHYPTMPLEKICALPVAGLATPDAAFVSMDDRADLPRVAARHRDMGLPVCHAFGVGKAYARTWALGSQ